MTTTTVDTPTLGSLYSRADLRLRAVGSDDAESRAARVRGVHSSDLLDPTPFLSEGLVLLTTGTQFLDSTDDDDYDAYVARLRTRGVTALGFGTEVVRDGVPGPLAAACAARRLPLFEVPYRTPFIAVARANAESIAAEEYSRRSWALAAQRSLSLAALRVDGLGATLDELSRQLQGWVGMFDAAGTLTHQHPAGGIPVAAASQLGAEVGAILRRGARAGSALRIDDIPFHLQTLGRGGHLRGAIAVSVSELDQEARGVVTTVVAMAGLALEQRQSLSHARSALRAGLATALFSGETTLTRRVARTVWGGFPTAPVLVALTEPVAARREDVAEWLEATAMDAEGALFFGRVEDGLALILPPGRREILDTLAARFRVTVGVSSPVRLEAMADALVQARLARERGQGGVSDFATARGGILSVFDDAQARAIAAAELDPLLAHDRDQGTALVPTLRAWLDADAGHEAAARALGVHRHTVRARLALAERVLGRDLGSFATRAQLWLALRALD